MILKFLAANFYNFFENIAYIYKLRNKPHNVYAHNQSLLEQNLNYYIQKADEYFEHLADNPYHLNKPFENPIETPEFLWKFGLVLSNLRLGVEQTILDFGCGTCWTSDFLKRMGLIVYALDVSKNALSIGKKVVEFNNRTRERGKIEFLRFNGTNIPLDDNSVDRILCFDSFHHVPNIKNILKEFFRVLKDGGIVGMSEPGWGHSKSPQSIKEMENYGVVENDIILEKIWDAASAAGFKCGWVKPCLPKDFSIPINEFNYAKFGIYKKNLKRIIGSQFENMIIFYLQKGDLLNDSRRPSILSAEILPSNPKVQLTKNSEFNYAISIKNTGDTKWLCKTFSGKGEVKLGMHLYNKNFQLISYDFDRANLPKDIEPGESINLPIQRLYNLEKGEYYLMLDMVVEHIKWFSNEIKRMTKIELIVL